MFDSVSIATTECHWSIIAKFVVYRVCRLSSLSDRQRRAFEETFVRTPFDMKKLVGIVCIALAAITMLFSAPASAEPDLAVGKQVFAANCVACHKGGANLVIANKNLQKATLAQYGMDSMEAIQTQITKGKNAMPAFAGRLDPNQIESVAAYVFAQADAGW